MKKGASIESGSAGHAGASESWHILRGALISLFGLLLKSGGRIGFILLAALGFSTDAVGKFAAVSVVVQITAAVAVFGMRRSLYAELNRLEPEDAPQVLLSGLALAAGIAIVLALALAGVSSFLVPEKIVPAKELWLLCLVPVIASSEICLVGTRHYGVLRYHVMARNVAEPWMLAILTGLFALVSPTPTGLLVAYAGATLCAFSVTAVGLARCLAAQRLKFAAPSLRRAWHLLGHSAPTAISDITEQLFRRLDVYILSIFAPHSEVGVYYLARQVALLIQNVKQVLDPVIDPLISRMTVVDGLKRACEQLHLVTRWIFTVQLALLIAILVPGMILLDILGNNLQGALAVLGLLMAGELFLGTTAPLELPMLVLRRRLNAIAALIALLLYTLACLVLCPRLGAVGAATGFAAGLATLAAARLGMVWVALGAAPLARAMIKPVLAGLLAALAGFAILAPVARLDAALAFGIVAAGILAAYFLALAVQGLEPADRELVTRLRQRVSGRRVAPAVDA